MAKTTRQQAIDDANAAEAAFQAEQTKAADAVRAERVEAGIVDPSSVPGSIVGGPTRRGRFAHDGIRLRRKSSVFTQPTPAYVDQQLKAQQDKELAEDERIAQEIARFMETIRVKYNLVDDDGAVLPRDANYRENVTGTGRRGPVVG